MYYLPAMRSIIIDIKSKYMYINIVFIYFLLLFITLYLYSCLQVLHPITTGAIAMHGVIRKMIHQKKNVIPRSMSRPLASKLTLIIRYWKEYCVKIQANASLCNLAEKTSEF